METTERNMTLAEQLARIITLHETLKAAHPEIDTIHYEITDVPVAEMEAWAAMTKGADIDYCSTLERMRMQAINAHNRIDLVCWVFSKKGHPVSTYTGFVEADTPAVPLSDLRAEACGEVGL